MIETRDRNIIFNKIRLAFRESEIPRKTAERAVHGSIKGVRGGKMYVCAKC